MRSRSHARSLRATTNAVAFSFSLHLFGLLAASNCSLYVSNDVWPSEFGVLALLPLILGVNVGPWIFIFSKSLLTVTVWFSNSSLTA